MFGATLDRALSFADLLATSGVERGLIGPREVPRLWDRHLLNCAVVVPSVREGSTVADVGSGAGLPGLVWALARPDLQVTLIEPMLRRIRFLEEACRELDLHNVDLRRARAEELHGEADFEVVTARALAPLERLVRWCLPLVRPGGRLIAFKGESATDEIATALSTLRLLGATDTRVAFYGEGVVGIPTRVVEVTVAPTTRADGPRDRPASPIQSRRPD